MFYFSFNCGILYSRGDNSVDCLLSNRAGVSGRRRNEMCDDKLRCHIHRLVMGGMCSLIVMLVWLGDLARAKSIISLSQIDMVLMKSRGKFCNMLILIITNLE